MRGMIAAAMIVTAPPAAQSSARTQVLAAMTESAAGWNADDLDRFVDVYAPDATFVIRTGVVQGKAAIAERYRSNYAGGTAKNGRLTFEPVAFRSLGPASAVLVARWRLTPVSGTAQGGMTTVVFARGTDGWKIVTDHSS